MYGYTSKFSHHFSKENKFCDFLFASKFPGQHSSFSGFYSLILLHSEQPNLAILSAVGLRKEFAPENIFHLP